MRRVLEALFAHHYVLLTSELRKPISQSSYDCWFLPFLKILTRLLQLLETKIQVILWYLAINFQPRLYNFESSLCVNVYLYNNLPETRGWGMSGHRLRLEWHHAVYSSLRVQGSICQMLSNRLCLSHSQWTSGVNRITTFSPIYIQQELESPYVAFLARQE